MSDLGFWLLAVGPLGLAGVLVALAWGVEALRTREAFLARLCARQWALERARRAPIHVLYAALWATDAHYHWRRARLLGVSMPYPIGSQESASYDSEIIAKILSLPEGLRV